MYKHEKQLVRLYDDAGKIIWQEPAEVTLWLASEHDKSPSFFVYDFGDGTSVGTLDLLLDQFTPTEHWCGAIGPWGQRGGYTLPPIEVSANLVIDGHSALPIRTVRFAHGLADTDWLMFDGVGPEPLILQTPDSGAASSHPTRASIIEAIDEVERFTHEIEDSASSEPERAIARSVREGLTVLRFHAETPTDEALTRAALSALQTWGAHLRNLAGYGKLAELGIRIGNLVQEFSLG